MYRQISLSQWTTMLQGNVVSHWLSPYPDLFLQYSVLVDTQHAEASLKMFFIQNSFLTLSNGKDL